MDTRRLLDCARSGVLVLHPTNAGFDSTSAVMRVGQVFSRRHWRGADVISVIAATSIFVATFLAGFLPALAAAQEWCGAPAPAGAR